MYISYFICIYRLCVRILHIFIRFLCNIFHIFKHVFAHPVHFCAWNSKMGVPSRCINQPSCSGPEGPRPHLEGASVWCWFSCIFKGSIVFSTLNIIWNEEQKFPYIYETATVFNRYRISTLNETSSANVACIPAVVEIPCSNSCRHNKVQNMPIKTKN